MEIVLVIIMIVCLFGTCITPFVILCAIYSGFEAASKIDNLKTEKPQDWQWFLNKERKEMWGSFLILIVSISIFVGCIYILNKIEEIEVVPTNIINDVWKDSEQNEKDMESLLY